MQTHRVIRALGMLSQLALFSACNPDAFDEVVGSGTGSAADAGALDGASGLSDASEQDARELFDATVQPPGKPSDGSAIDAQVSDAAPADRGSLDAGAHDAAVDAAVADAAVTDASAGPACFAAAASLISYFPLDGSPLDAITPERGGASVVASGAGFDLGRVGGSLHAGELAITQSRLDAPSALTISAWLRLESTPDALNVAWLWKGDGSGSDLTTGYWLVVAGPSFRAENARYLSGTAAQGHLGFALTDGSEEQFLLSDAPFPLLRYVHVVATFDGSRARLYFDGAVVRDEPQLVLARATSTPLRLASTLGGAVAPLLGELDEVALFDRALSPADVGELYRQSGIVCTE